MSVVEHHDEPGGDHKAIKNNPKTKIPLPQDLMSSSYETNPPPCLVPSTVRDLFIRANIEYALANTWGFTNQCSFFGRPDLLPKYDCRKVQAPANAAWKNFNSPCLYVCVNLRFVFLSARRWIQQQLADMTDLTSRLACVDCVFWTSWSFVPQLQRRHHLMLMYWDTRLCYQLAAHKGYIG